MKKSITLLAVVAALALTGCVHTRTVAPGDTAGPSYFQINQLGARKTATVWLDDGRALKAQRLQMSRDSTSWFLGEQFERVATSEIREVQFSHRGKGALEGFGIGLASGIVLGIVSGYAQGDTPPAECGWFEPCTAEEKATVGAVLLGGLGALTGPIVGASKGSQTIYRFEAPALAPPVVVEHVEQQRPSRE